MIDALVLLVVAVAAVAGFRRMGGSARAGALLGLLVGAGLGSGLSVWLVVGGGRLTAASGGNTAADG